MHIHSGIPSRLGYADAGVKRAMAMHRAAEYFVYINNLAKFTRAPNPTPIDRWILKQRFKSGEISKDSL